MYLDPSSRLECRRPVRNKSRADLGDAVREGELEIGRHELLDVRTADILALLDLHNTENVDRPETGTVPGSHVLVEALDSISTAELTELLVHVVRAGTRVIAKPDTEVLDF